MYAGSADRSLDPTKRDIGENFNSYGLAIPDLVRMDNHLFDRHIRSFQLTGIDAILMHCLMHCTHWHQVCIVLCNELIGLNYALFNAMNSESSIMRCVLHCLMAIGWMTSVLHSRLHRRRVWVGGTVWRHRDGPALRHPGRRQEVRWPNLT
jgi:hypothetical protein